jgi:hypothetical protein
MNSGQRTEMIDAARVVEEQFRLGVADIFGDGARQLAIRNGGIFDDKCHCLLLHFSLAETIRPR